jgi:pimeloyl-ACP methyl ester carboxylesterase
MIHFLHGFLGRPNDWPMDADQFSKSCQFHDLYDLVLNPASQLALSKTVGPEDIFIGYSMGGRFWNMFLKNFNLPFAQLILISSHIGLSNQEQKKIRKNFDELTLKKIATLSTSDFLHFWNNLPVFAFDAARDALPTQGREILFKTYETMQLHQMDNYASWLRQHSKHVHYLFGTHDEKYVELANIVAGLGIKTYPIAGGHRLIGSKQLNEVLINILSQYDRVEPPHVIN